jgi:hypothetical protein
LATSTQIRRLQNVERALPGEPTPGKPDISVLTVPELKVMERFVQGEHSEDDLQRVENSIYPKLYPNRGGTNPA